MGDEGDEGDEEGEEDEEGDERGDDDERSGEDGEDGDVEAPGAAGDTVAPGGSFWSADAVLVPVAALSDSRNTPSTSPARRVRRGPGRFMRVIRASPEASLLP
ncbi:hypothetical protein ACFV99_32960 [Streptomyces sp. NPDC059944]|uniref:hypothetical protein n=1 Tax=unclassified Streptomyces TaxID=2593676 RepID=UPI00364B55C8